MSLNYNLQIKPDFPWFVPRFHSIQKYTFDVLLNLRKFEVIYEMKGFESCQSENDNDLLAAGLYPFVSLSEVL